MGSHTELDLGGLTVVLHKLKMGATAPGQSGTELDTTELGTINGVTAGTVTASKAVVVDSNKDASAFRNITVTNLDAGASGTAGTVDVFPTTASKGKLAVTCTDQTGNTTVTLTAGAMGQATAITIPDPGGATADVVLTAGAQTIAGAKTFSANPVLGAGTTLDLDSATATLSSHAATVTKYAVQVTTEALTTAAGAAQAFVITLTGVAATDLAFVQAAGGTNTREHYVYKAICTTNTITVTVNNIGPTNALNGTLIFNLWVVKA